MVYLCAFLPGLRLRKAWLYTVRMIRMRAQILALALALSLGSGFVPDCFSHAASSSASAMACCKSMPCNPANHTRDCCRRISHRSVAYVLSPGPAPVTLVASRFSRINAVVAMSAGRGFERTTCFSSRPQNQNPASVTSLRI